MTVLVKVIGVSAYVYSKIVDMAAKVEWTANDLGVNPDIIIDYQKLVIPTLIGTKRRELPCVDTQ